MLRVHQQQSCFLRDIQRQDRQGGGRWCINHHEQLFWCLVPSGLALMGFRGRISKAVGAVVLDSTSRQEARRHCSPWVNRQKEADREKSRGRQTAVVCRPVPTSAAAAPAGPDQGSTAIAQTNPNTLGSGATRQHDNTLGSGTTRETTAASKFKARVLCRPSLSLTRAPLTRACRPGGVAETADWLYRF